jgi:hypothetical protein
MEVAIFVESAQKQEFGELIIEQRKPGIPMRKLSSACEPKSDLIKRVRRLTKIEELSSMISQF